MKGRRSLPEAGADSAPEPCLLILPDCAATYVPVCKGETELDSSYGLYTEPHKGSTQLSPSSRPCVLGRSDLVKSQQQIVCLIPSRIISSYYLQVFILKFIFSPNIG